MTQLGYQRNEDVAHFHLGTVRDEQATNLICKQDQTISVKNTRHFTRLVTINDNYIIINQDMRSKEVRSIYSNLIKYRHDHFRTFQALLGHDNRFDKSHMRGCFAQLTQLSNE